MSRYNTVSRSLRQRDLRTEAITEWEKLMSLYSFWNYITK